jgi:hypothetical protein
VRMQRVGVFTQAEGHFVIGFGYTVNSDTPSFGILCIHVFMLNQSSEQSWFIEVC